MAYELRFVPEALEDWADLDGSVKKLFKMPVPNKAHVRTN